MTGFEPLSSGELDLLEAVYDGSLPDTCVMMTRTTATDWNRPKEIYLTSTTFSCEFGPHPGNEVMSQTDVEMPDGRLRLPLAAEVHLLKNNRIKITHRFGEALTTPVGRRTYEIEGPPLRSPAGIIVDLKLATI